jgi:hypothetical protein
MAVGGIGVRLWALGGGKFETEIQTADAHGFSVLCDSTRGRLQSLNVEKQQGFFFFSFVSLTWLACLHEQMKPKPRAHAVLDRAMGCTQDGGKSHACVNRMVNLFQFQ